MRRADRLFRLVELLKARRKVITAQQLANEMEVSPRTIYRDIADLIASGIPITGEAGVGYMLSKDHKVQPLMFGLEEIDALMLGAKMVACWGDKGLAQAASQAIDKLTTTLPEHLQEEIAQTFLFSSSPQSRDDAKINIDFTRLRRAIRSKNKLEFHYEDENKQQTERTVRPLSLVFFSPIWLLVAWCEKRDDFRNFRVDRIQVLNVLDAKFKDEKGKRFSDFCEREGLCSDTI